MSKESNAEKAIITAFQTIVTNHSLAILENPSRVEAMLKDLCPAWKIKPSLLVRALEGNIHRELLNGDGDFDHRFRQSVERLQRRFSFQPAAAAWAVASWAKILGLDEEIGNFQPPDAGAGIHRTFETIHHPTHGATSTKRTLLKWGVACLLFLVL